MDDLYAPKIDYQVEDNQNPTSFKDRLVDFIQSIVVIGAIFAIVYLFVAQPHKVSGSSMIPTFRNGDYILTDKVTYHFKNPQKGDVVVLKNPRNETQDFLKRIVALPGDTIILLNDSVYVNNQPILEKYLAPATTTHDGNFLHEGEEIKAGQNQHFVFGDNRNASSDSREWGPVSKEEIIGRVIFRYWPLDSFGLIINP